MRRIALLLLVVLAPFLVYGQADQSNSWDFFLYESWWPGAEQVSPVPSNITAWNLHGLWPTRNDTTWPESCDSSYPFEETQITSLLPKMNIYWYNFLTPGDPSFWAHEWTKHGTCSLEVLRDEFAYFNTTLNLQAQVDTLGILTKAGFIPSEETKYKLKDIEDALTQALGIPPIIDCTTKKNKVLLFSLAYCVSKGLQIYQCDPAIQSDNRAHCKDEEVYILPIVYGP
eukprot:TRINITY_DN18015_c0_g1_i1.p1 TRINITY_DN18015_c0_g1~~TRINITY_DN18015_c0_g1_i1.p1  ORF type:complete len:228 (-),score=37.03 TRINITY_DN18015_c0_g1_i1:210-893(-)